MGKKWLAWITPIRALNGPCGKAPQNLNSFRETSEIHTRVDTLTDFHHFSRFPCSGFSRLLSLSRGRLEGGLDRGASPSAPSAEAAFPIKPKKLPNKPVNAMCVTAGCLQAQLYASPLGFSSWQLPAPIPSYMETLEPPVLCLFSTPPTAKGCRLLWKLHFIGQHVECYKCIWLWFQMATQTWVCLCCPLRVFPLAEPLISSRVGGLAEWNSALKFCFHPVSCGKRLWKLRVVAESWRPGSSSNICWESTKNTGLY